MNDNYSPPPPGLPAGARVWAYLRDSGGPAQSESTDQQEKEIRDYCKKNNLTLAKVFRDVAKSGGSTIKRDEFMAMIDQSEDETIRPDVLLIWNFARFARNLRQSQIYKGLLRENGIIVHSLTDKIPANDDSSNTGELVEGITDWMNEEKRRQISRDVKRGLKSLVAQGFAPGNPPRGYIGVKVNIGEKRDHMPRIVSKWVPDPVLSEYVKLAWQLRAAGKSYQEITKATKGKLYTSSNSWHSFFENKTYVGYYGQVPDHHEPLIPHELFEAVQKIREAHPRYGQTGYLNHPRRVSHPRLLSGFTYCQECGAMMTHNIDKRTKEQPWHHYICGKKVRHGKDACPSRRVSAVHAETQITNIVLNQVLTPEYLSEAIEETKKHLDSTPEIERQITAEKRTLEDLDLAIQRTLNTIEKTGSQAAQDRLAQREAERTQTIFEIEKLSMQLATAQTEITPEALEIVIAAWREQFNKLHESGNVREIKAWLLQFVFRIELGYNQARIFYTYPMTDLIDQSHKSAPPYGGTNDSHL